MRSSSRFVVAVAVTLLFIFIASGTAAAQEVDSAIVVGAVLDSSQAAVVGATVTLTHLATNAETVVHTNERGEYRTPPLRLGEYTVKVEAPGFKQFNQRGIVLNIGDVRPVDAVLEVGEISQQVTVEAEAPLLQTEDSTVGTVVTNQQITELPLNGRDYLQLAALSGGTTSAGGNGVAIGGQAAGQVAFLLDGQDNNNQQIGLHSNQKDVIEPSIDAIQEFKVVTNGYSAEYGRSSSGVVSVVLKSGTNQFHGTGYEFVRNEVLDARNFFQTPGTIKPPFGRDQFGGAIGGPVIHNKTFFFGDFEIGRIRESSTVLSTLPSDAERDGEFPTIDPTTGKQVVLKNPATGQPFPIIGGSYVIPQTSIDPIAQKILALVPHAQTGAALNNYEYNGPENTDTNRWDFRIDQIISDKQNLYFRYSSQLDNIGITSSLPPNSAVGYYAGSGGQISNSKSFVLTYNRVLSTNLIFSAHAGWNYIFWTNIFPAQSLTGIGIPGVLATNPGFSGISVSGPGITMPSLGISNIPNEDGSEDRQISGDLTWTKGSHNIKFGVQAYWLQTNFLSSQNSSGNFTFNGQYTGNAFADFLLGDASAGTLSNYSKLYFRVPEAHLYVQDDWKVTRRLTFNLGLRWEYTPPAVDLFNGISNFEMNNTNPYAGNPQLIQAAGSSLASRSLQGTYYKQFAPRGGFAYSLDSKTVVRGGYGIFYANFDTIGGMQSMERNPPNNVVASISPSKTTPSLFLQSGFPAGTVSVANATNVQLNSWDTRNIPPTDYQYNLNVQRELPGGFLLEVGYVGNHYDHGWWQIDGNPAPPGPGAINARRIFTSTLVPGTSDYITLSSVKRIQHDAYGNYNGLQTKIEKRYAHGVSVIASYAYSKAMALGDASGLQNPQNWAAEYAVSSLDMTHHFVGSAVYDLPFGKDRRFGNHWHGVVNSALGGWSVEPIVTANSGMPLNLSVTGDPSNTGQNDRPNIVGDWHVASPSVNEWFNPAAFAPNASYTYGNAGRDLLRSPGLFNIDLAAHKNFRITERVSAQFRVESFNFTNTPPLNAPNAVIGTAGVGVISSAGNPRQLQLGVKALF